MCKHTKSKFLISIQNMIFEKQGQKILNFLFVSDGINKVYPQVKDQKFNRLIALIKMNNNNIRLNLDLMKFLAAIQFKTQPQPEQQVHDLQKNNLNKSLKLKFVRRHKSQKQKVILFDQFKKTQEWSRELIEQLSLDLNLTPTQIYKWYYDKINYKRKKKDKKQCGIKFIHQERATISLVQILPKDI
ncbi:UNKNOWN [Stylonychia lemnae]|uniref:Homeobox domain-containing protein n=1 Tax=Stylonychia lemnae TaxID=5949 RepID=A0A078A208_STYLE|nr:UNKNOWN [Stylonychia lemnae]|eukprot:CDW75523.1 UNKNOWN [Stylonychia lemnae]